MDFSPMNIRMAVPHTNDVAEIQNNLNQYGNIVHNYRTNKDKEQQQIRQKQVLEKEKADQERIKDDPDRQKKQGGYTLSKREKKLIDALDIEEETNEDNEFTMAVDHLRGQHLDISG